MKRNGQGYSVVVGGAGFIGSNLANRLANAGNEVVILDNLSRDGVERNVEWLKVTHGPRVHLEIGDVRDAATVAEIVGGAKEVFQCAAQVAVTTSLSDPMHDFEVNALGTLRVLEAVRRQLSPPPVIFTSTNKVYGALGDVAMKATTSRYVPEEECLRAHGVGEDRPLDFHSPYGCSKGAADQYVLDYARSFGIPAVVFRMSCIYGPRQFGTEDQGWVAHFLLAARRGEPITIYGDGRQVRDVLFVDDLMDAFMRVRANMVRASGHAFNVGGGVSNAISLLEVIQHLETLTGHPIDVTYGPWRTGDQLYYVSDTRKIEAATGWRAQVPVPKGLALLERWMRESFNGAPVRVRSPLFAPSNARHGA